MSKFGNKRTRFSGISSQIKYCDKCQTEYLTKCACKEIKQGRGNIMKLSAETVLKFVVHHIINAGGQDTHEYLVQIVAEKFKISKQASWEVVEVLDRNEYIQICSEDHAPSHVYVVYITKKACDQIRAYNARDEHEERARRINADAHAVL